MLIFLVAIYFSSWDGHIISQNVMGKYTDQNSCQVIADRINKATTRSQAFCIRDAIEITPTQTGDKK